MSYWTRFFFIHALMLRVTMSQEEKALVKSQDNQVETSIDIEKKKIPNSFHSSIRRLRWSRHERLAGADLPSVQLTCQGGFWSLPHEINALIQLYPLRLSDPFQWHHQSRPIQCHALGYSRVLGVLAFAGQKVHPHLAALGQCHFLRDYYVRHLPGMPFLAAHHSAPLFWAASPHGPPARTVEL